MMYLPLLSSDTSIAVRLATGVFLCLLVRLCVRWLQQEAITRRFGGHAASVHSWYDISGLGYLLAMVKHASRDENLLFFHNCLVATGRGKKHNPQTYEFGIAGERRVVTADADNIKAILATQFRDFEKGDRFRRDWKGLLGRSIFTLDGPDWHHNRQFLRPHFARQRISDLACFERHLAHLFPLLDGEQTIDASTVMAHFAFDAAADFSLGTTQVQSLLNPSHTFIKAFERVHRTQTLIEYTTPLGWWLIPRRQYNADIKTMAEFVDPLLDKALAMSDEDLQKCLADDSSGTNSGSTRFSFLAACAAVSRDRSFLRDEITTIILAARDTTAMTLTWCLFELARHPDAVAELREEIRSTLGSGRKPTYEDIKNMPVLSHTLNETLRLYPAIPYNARVAAQDTSLPRGGGEDGMGPIGLPKGTLVYFSTHLLHLRRDIYPPGIPAFPLDEFHPRRWDKWRPEPWTYIPFSGGPRTCIGQQFALVEMSYVLVRLFQRYSKISLVQQPQPKSNAKVSNPSEWDRNDDQGEPELADLYMRTRPRMASEITLNPRDEILIKFIA